MMDGPTRPRILYLDGLRCVAILAVILFHYFSTWTLPEYDENLYPYGNAFLPLFQHGFYGVYLFFVVSGFVITLTLYRCSSPFEFAVRRFARLWPSMVLCSMATLLLTRIIPNHSFRVSPLGLIPSLTFLEPDVLNRLVPQKPFDWIDGSYWTLFVEVRFYFLAALVFFYRKDKFAANMYLFGSITIALSLLVSLSNFLGVRLRGAGYCLDLLFVASYLPWFLLGIAFYLREHRVEKKLRQRLFLVGVVSLLAQGVLNRSYPDIAISVVIPLLCLAGSRVHIVNRILSNKLLTGVGAASYSLYLLHQFVGVSLIGWLGECLKFRGPYSAILAIVTASLFVIISRMIYTYWETPLNRFIIVRLTSTPLAIGATPGSSASSPMQ